MALDEEILKLIERQENEPPNAFTAFLFFASLIPSERPGHIAFPKVAAHVQTDVQNIRRWFNNYQWDERVSTYDAYVFLENHKQRSQLAQQDNIRWVEEHRKAKDRTLNIADKMLSVAENLLSTAEMSGKVIETDKIQTADGRMVPTKTIIHMKSKVSDIPRLVEVAVKTQRLAADLPTEIIEDRDGIMTADLSTLTDEELQSLIEKNNKEIIQLGATAKVTGDDRAPIG